MGESVPDGRRRRHFAGVPLAAGGQGAGTGRVERPDVERIGRPADVHPDGRVSVPLQIHRQSVPGRGAVGAPFARWTSAREHRRLHALRGDFRLLGRDHHDGRSHHAQRTVLARLRSLARHRFTGRCRHARLSDPAQSHLHHLRGAVADLDPQTVRCRHRTGAAARRLVRGLPVHQGVVAAGGARTPG